MDESRYFPKKVYVTKDSRNSFITRRVLENTGHLPVEFITDSRELIEDVLMSRNPVGEGKKLLLVTHQRGGYVKPCPCTPKYIGCNYFIINTELNCPLDCSYCILQLYLNNPLITVHTNTAELFRQLDDFLHKNRNRTFRIGTGELGDSLALDHLTDRSPIIHYEGWEDGYAKIIDDLMAHIDRKKIAWISLGSLRFPPALKPVIQKRFPQTKIIYDEFITGKDGKLRYPKPLRLRLFQQVFGDLKKAGGGEIPVYFCMESRDIWMDVQKKAPRSKKEVEKLLTLPLGANDF